MNFTQTSSHPAACGACVNVCAECMAVYDRDRYRAILAETLTAFRAYVTAGEEVGHLPRVQWLMTLHHAEEALNAE